MVPEQLSCCAKQIRSRALAGETNVDEDKDVAVRLVSLAMITKSETSMTEPIAIHVCNDWEINALQPEQHTVAQPGPIKRVK